MKNKNLLPMGKYITMGKTAITRRAPLMISPSKMEVITGSKETKYISGTKS